MLAHPPFLHFQLPLAIEYIHRGSDGRIPPVDERLITQVLHHRRRVGCIRLNAPYSAMVFRALDGEFPVLKYLCLKIPNGPCFNWQPPRTFRTPDLKRLLLDNVICPLQSLLSTPDRAKSLATLSLTEIREPDKFGPNDLLQLLSLTLNLETLRIGFTLFSSTPAAEVQMMGLPIRTHVKLEYLRRFLFNGTSAYLGALLPHISTPLLEKLQIYISNWKSTSIPDILQVMKGSGNLRSDDADLMFLDKGVFLRANLTDGIKWSDLSISLHGNDFTWQVQSAAQFFGIHRACFISTRRLTIRYRPHTSSPQRHPGPDPAQWGRLLREFPNVNALLVYDGLHGELSRPIQTNLGESSTELFPSLRQLSIQTSGMYRDACVPFVNARKDGNYVSLVHVGKAPSASDVVISCEAWEAPWLWGSFRLRLA